MTLRISNIAFVVFIDFSSLHKLSELRKVLEFPLTRAICGVFGNAVKRNALGWKTGAAAGIWHYISNSGKSAPPKMGNFSTFSPWNPYLLSKMGLTQQVTRG
jgi:hypothetical protein